ncbi:MAG: deaminase [candidate division Zixibacteria bacterium]|nr:deaminase [candidate division Zixibacteria bacterium]
MDLLHTGKAPKAIAPYSQGVIFLDGKLLYTCGQIPMDADGNVISGGIEEQTKQALNNIEEILKAGGSSKDKIVKVTIFLSDLADFEKMNEVYAGFMDGHKPVRSTVEVSRLPKDVLIEIEVMAER